MKQIHKRLTYANVMSSIAVFLLVGGATAFAASQLGKNTVGAKQLKKNAVTAAKIKKNAVTTAKIKDAAVTTTKIKDGAVTTTKIGSGAVTNAQLGAGAVNFANIASGTNVIATASGGPVAVNSATTTLTPIPLNGTTSFTPTAGVVDLLSIEARGNLTRSGASTCFVSVVPYINGKAFQVSSGFLSLASDSSPASETTPIPIDSETGPVGLGLSGAQQISAKTSSSTNCAAGSQVSVSIAVTQLK